MMVLHTGLAAFIAGSVLLASDRRLISEHIDAATFESRSEETAEEVHGRLAGVRRLHRIIGMTIIGLCVVLALAVLISARGSG